VVLRVSGTEVAKGELVHVDGELGVRILSRTGEVFR
jgi:flagellar motor switch/type III secretory pathway protein FliN